MICINCFHAKTNVTNSRPSLKQSAVWRRRRCEACQLVFTSYERPALDQKTTILSDDGTKTPFRLGKLTLSIAAAFSHDTNAGQIHCLHLAETVEQLLIREVRTPSTQDIAAYAHIVLKRFDELAALQYAAKHQLVVSLKRRGRPSIGPTLAQ